MACQRCQGLLVRDTFHDPSVETGVHGAATRCINCGHMEDAVIRVNRVRDSGCRQGTPGGREGWKGLS